MDGTGLATANGYSVNIFKFYNLSMIKLVIVAVFASLLACQEEPKILTGTVANTVSEVQLVKKEAQVPINDLLGKIEPSSDKRFEKISAPYTRRSDIYLRAEVYAAFKKMHEAAQKAGVKLVILSATRTFDQQTSIWNGKWQRFAAATPDPESRARKILEYSSMPGSSRHHWGTDIDLNDLNNPSFNPGGAHQKVYEWLVAHAGEFGFGQPYTAGRDRGYFEERWHWSYLPLAKSFLQEYNTIMSDTLFSGFSGAELARKIGIVENYVNGINPNCK